MDWDEVPGWMELVVLLEDHPPVRKILNLARLPYTWAHRAEVITEIQAAAWGISVSWMIGGVHTRFSALPKEIERWEKAGTKIIARHSRLLFSARARLRN